jgi:hypothetical protein
MPSKRNVFAAPGSGYDWDSELGGSDRPGPHDELQQNGGYRRVAKDLSILKENLRGRAGKNSSRGQAGREPVTSVAKVESDRSRKNSRTKGNRAELDVAGMFSEWCGEVIRRTPQSGGWSNAQFGVTADLVCANPNFNYHCEIKHREGWILDDLVTGTRRDHDKSIVQWWSQCLKSCPKKAAPLASVLAKEPLLVFRRNRQPWLVMIRAHVPSRRTCLFLIQTAEFGNQEVVVMRLDDFLMCMPVPTGLKNHGKMTK